MLHAEWTGKGNDQMITTTGTEAQGKARQMLQQSEAPLQPAL